MEKIYDILVVGELNVDLILDDIEKFPEVGKEVLAQKMTLTLGSSSAIFASNISALGRK
jgi:sugar/nucleoside kinase (ribokinase family)